MDFDLTGEYKWWSQSPKVSQETGIWGEFFYLADRIQTRPH